MTDDNYQPKHLKNYRMNTTMSHCCFAGCTPMGCEGRCCANMGWHEPWCPLSLTRSFEELDHDQYVTDGLRKHLKKESA